MWPPRPLGSVPATSGFPGLSQLAHFAPSVLHHLSFSQLYFLSCQQIPPQNVFHHYWLFLSLYQSYFLWLKSFLARGGQPSPGASPHGGQEVWGGWASGGEGSLGSCGPGPAFWNCFLLRWQHWWQQQQDAHSFPIAIVKTVL